jgi:tripartite-type tricarboxylate transporter receptor subunit TctC
MARTLKQAVVVDNRGNGLVAMESGARAAPDGYTLTVGTAATLTINPSVYRKLAYGHDDYVYLCKAVEFPLVLVAHPSVAVKDVAQLGAWLKANPKQASYASYQPGTPSHFLGHQLGDKLGIALTHIPYRGSAPQVTDLLGGVVPFGFTQVATALPHIRSGKLVALATTGGARWDTLKDVPTLDEQGLGELTTTAWFGLLAPKGTPADVQARLVDAQRAALADADTRARLASQGLGVAPVCGAEFVDLVKRETQRWAAVVKATGFTAAD